MNQQVAGAGEPAPPPAPRPVIDLIQPETMSDEDVVQGAELSIFGAGWKPELQVLFGTTPSPGVRIESVEREGSRDRLRAQVPRGIGEVPVKIKNPDGQESNALTFTYKGDWELKFDPDKDLPKFLNVRNYDYARWIVDLEPFKARKGQTITSKEREKIREAWKPVLKACEDEVEAIRTDPRVSGAYRLAMGLHTLHPYFKEVDFTIIKQLPFVYYVQRPPKDDAAYGERIVAKFSPYLEALRSIFQKEYVAPLGLKLGLDPEVFCIAILPSGGSYRDDFSVALGLGQGGMRNQGAHYDPGWRLAVTYEAEFEPMSKDQDRRNAILHEFVHALQHMYSSGGMPKPIWYNEGLAEYLAAGGPEDVDGLSRRAFPRGHGLNFHYARAAPDGKAYINTVRDLVTADGPGYAAVLHGALDREAKGSQEEVVPKALGTFYAQATLMVHFLHEGAGRKYAAGFLEYMKAVQGGASGWESFTRAFPGVDPETLHKEFLEFVDSQSPK